jgi:uncharacterized lipoprotein
MTISFHRTAVTFILITLLSGCSWFGKDEPEYLDSIEVEQLKIPEGLDDPTRATSVVISEPGMRLPADDELEPMPPQVVRTTGNQDTNARMIWTAEGVYLLLKDTPESATKRLRIAIENSGMKLLDKDDSGAHRFQYDQPRSKNAGFFSRMAFWRKRPADYSGTYQTSFKADGEHTRVYLLLASGESSSTAGSEHILGLLIEELD